MAHHVTIERRATRARPFSLSPPHSLRLTAPLSLPPLSQTILIGCNHNTAPPPLNWQMWCADGADASWPVGGKASVTQWGAEDGTFHRKIVLDPQPGLTAEAMIWYTTALSSPTVEWAGRVSFFFT